MEARPSDAAARAAEIVIDNLNGGPSELLGAIGEPVLAPLALPVVHELIGCRLADVDEGAAREMSAVILVIADFPGRQRRGDLAQQSFHQSR